MTTKLSLVVLFVLMLTSCIESGRSPDEIMSNHSSGTNSSSDVVEATPTIIERPDEDITIDNDFCSCISQLSDILGGGNSCDSFCASATDSTTPTLYGSVTPGTEVLANEELGNLYNWCNVELLNEDGEGDTNPNCYFRVTDGVTTTDLAITISDNAFTVNLSTLDFDTIYLATIVEIKSGATTDYIQIQRVEQDDDDDVNLPLTIMPMSQYSCLTRSGSISDDDDEYYDEAVRLHYYFASNEDPDPIPAGSDSMLICHDPRVDGQGDTDNELYPRFELVEHSFYVWNKSHLLFYDLDSTGELDINEYIEEQLLEQYEIEQDISIFQEFNWPNSPLAEESTFSGYFMQPWIDTDTGLGFCPGSAEYYSGDFLFAVIRDVLGGIETEGIFLAVRQSVTITDPDTGEETAAPDDILIVRESDLEQVWFYYENSTYYTPTAVTAGQKTIRFYYPFDEDDPWVQKSYQYLYTVKAPESISESTSESASGLRTSVTAPDKRFGCIPKQSL